ncbi:MAG TPA: dienelactone hydrolase family protein [Ferruginibacter sp.]|jgi:carboxymethylenebutenolidase|nr:dienelactone hydrolase family protein [Ferruginibacter sp.]
MSTLNNYITVAVADGTSMDVYVAIPKQGSAPFPAIMVFQEAFGVTSHIRSIADRLAAQGYVAVAPELFHRTAAPGFEGSYTDFPSIMPHYSVLTTETMEADITATYDWLQQQTTVIKNKIGSIGFCMGGKVSMIANMILPLSAAISYYGSLTQPLIDRLPELHAPQLLFWGGLDKHILPEHTEAIVKGLKSANKEFINVDISYADHGFNCNDKASYNPKAAKEAWAISLAFLENNLRS